MTKDDMDLLKGFPLSIEQKERLLELIGNNKNRGGDDKIIFKFNNGLSVLSYNNIDYSVEVDGNNLTIIDTNLPSLIKTELLKGKYIVFLTNLEEDGRQIIFTSYVSTCGYVKQDNTFGVTTEFKMDGVTMVLNIYSESIN